MLRQDGRAAAAGAAAHAGDDQKGVDLVGGDAVDRALDLVDVLLGDPSAQFVVGTDAVALHAGLADEHAVLVGDVLEPEQVRPRGVDRDGRADDVAPVSIVVGQKAVDDLPAGLPESDHSKFHIVDLFSVVSTRRHGEHKFCDRIEEKRLRNERFSRERCYFASRSGSSPSASPMMTVFSLSVFWARRRRSESA